MFTGIITRVGTLDQVVELSPDRISIYNYAHLPDRFPPQKRILASDLPTPGERLDILQLCIEQLVDSGYVYIGMDHFAKPDDELNVARRRGTLQRNFQGYSTHAESDLLGLGVTAISHIGDTYSQNDKDLEGLINTWDHLLDEDIFSELLHKYRHAPASTILKDYK